MSDDITNPTPSNEVLRAELKALRHEIAGGFARIETQLGKASDANTALETRVRSLELAAAQAAGGERKAKELMALVAGAAGLLGSGITALIQWLAGKPSP